LIVAEALLAGEQPGVSRLAVSKRRSIERGSVARQDPSL